MEGSNLIPVEGYETHTQAMTDNKHLVGHYWIVRSDPEDP